MYLKDTANTESYTKLNNLALHDALQICDEGYEESYFSSGFVMEVFISGRKPETQEAFATEWGVVGPVINRKIPMIINLTVISVKPA